MSVDKSEPPSPPEELPDSMVRAIRKEILLWRKAQLARKADLSDRTIANVDHLEWVSEITCLRIVQALNQALREVNERGQLGFPFVELELLDLFELKFN